MSEYTPTTAHVRSAYRDAVRGPTKDTGAEFDRWLESVIADVMRCSFENGLIVGRELVEAKLADAKQEQQETDARIAEQAPLTLDHIGYEAVTIAEYIREGGYDD